jgi:RNA polymerase sigma factor (TIGR02999 family)
MNSPEPPEISMLLRAWRHGDPVALERLAPMVQQELRSIARQYLHRQNPGHTLTPTALVNEAFLHLLGADCTDWVDRAHFFAFCAQVMRRILVDSARARGSEKRGGNVRRVVLNEFIDASPDRDSELIALDDALEALARLDPRKAKVVELRFFAGLSVEETAAVLDISPQSVMRDWKLARAWLTVELSDR